MSEKSLKISIAISGSQLEVENVHKAIEASGLDVKVTAPSALHMGMEEITLGLSLLGTAASIWNLFGSLREKKPNCEIQIRTEDNDVITLQKNKPWTIDAIKKVIRIGDD